jgi:hypothetical protein
MGSGVRVVDLAKRGVCGQDDVLYSVTSRISSPLSSFSRVGVRDSHQNFLSQIDIVDK